MLKRALLLLAFLASALLGAAPLEAQQNRGAPGRAWASPANLLDFRTDVVAAYSLRVIKSTYKGPLVRVRRSSDSAEADVYADNRGRLYHTAVLSWAAGSNLFLAKVYDQSGNARDLVQATAAAQPQLVFAANGFPAIRGDGVDDTMATGSFAVAQPISFLDVYRRVTDAQIFFMNLWSSTGTDVTHYWKNTPSNNSMHAGTEFLSNGTAQPTGTRGAVGGTFNGASALMEVNGATVSSFTGDTSTLGISGGITLFNSPLFASRVDNSELQALVLFNTTHASTKLKADNVRALRATGRF